MDEATEPTCKSTITVAPYRWPRGCFQPKPIGASKRAPSVRAEGEQTMATDLGWWAISGEALMDALHRANTGEDAGLLYAELYANTDSENV